MLDQKVTGNFPTLERLALAHLRKRFPPLSGVSLRRRCAPCFPPFNRKRCALFQVAGSSRATLSYHSGKDHCRRADRNIDGRTCGIVAGAVALETSRVDGCRRNLRPYAADVHAVEIYSKPRSEGRQRGAGFMI